MFDLGHGFGPFTSGSAGAGALYSGFTPTIYADTVDRGNGSGSSEANAMDLTTALATVTAGGIVGILPGVHVKAYDSGLDSLSSLFMPTNSGSAGNPIVVCCKYPAAYLSTPASNGNRTEFQYTGGVVATDTTNATVGVDSGNTHTAWYGFYIDQADAPAKPSHGTLQAFSCSDVTFAEFYVDQRDPDGYGGDNMNVLFAQDTPNLVVENFKIVSDHVAVGHNWACITFYGCPDFIIRHGYIEDAETAIFAKAYGGDGTVHNNGVIEYCWFERVGNPLLMNASGHTTESRRIEVRNCIAVKPGKFVVVDNTTGSPTVEGWETKNVWVYNCTIVNPENSLSGGFYPTGFLAEYAVDDARWYNNIVAYLVDPSGDDYFVNLGGSGAPPSEAFDTTNFSRLDYNCYYKPSGTSRWFTNGSGFTSFAAWEASVQGDVAGQEDHSITSDPNFVNAGAGNYRIVSGPCFGTGFGGINMGAYVSGAEEIGVETT